jgi:hypothetical protein
VFPSSGAKVLRQRDKVCGNISFSSVSSLLTAPLCINHATRKSGEQKNSDKGMKERRKTNSVHGPATCNTMKTHFSLCFPIQIIFCHISGPEYNPIHPFVF